MRAELPHAQEGKHLPCRVIGPGLVLFLLFVSSCGYTVSARPGLPEGIGSLAVDVLENDTPEPEVGVVMATALARRAESEGRLAGRDGGEARLVGRIEAVRASPVAFPGASDEAGMYALMLRVRLQLLPNNGDSMLSEVTVTGREHYRSGTGPEATEANRRLALERLVQRLAEEAWSELTAPR